MSDPKIISLQKYKKSQKLKSFKEKLLKMSLRKLINKLREDRKMLFIVAVTSAFIASFLWNYFVVMPSRLDVQIAPSQNITFNNTKPIPMTTGQVANEFEEYEGKPVLLYIYTTWCSSCARQTPVINEIAREFQNTDLKIITLAVDKDLNPNDLQSHLSRYGNVYFQPRYLSFKEGFLEFLKKKNINYQGRIPYTVLISQYGEVVTKYVGAKSPNYLRNKIIKEIYQ